MNIGLNLTNQKISTSTYFQNVKPQYFIDDDAQWKLLECDSWDDGKLLEEQGDKVLGLLGGEGRKFFRRFPLMPPAWFCCEKQEDGRTLCFGLSVGLGDRDRGDMELGECSGELARGGDGIERGLSRILYWRFVRKYSEDIIVPASLSWQLGEMRSDSLPPI